MVLTGNPQAVTITKSDVTVYSPPLLGVRVGSTAGALHVVSNGATVIFENVAVGELIPGEFTKVLNATTAVGLIGWKLPQ